MLRVWVFLSKTGRLTGPPVHLGSELMENISLSCMSGDKTPFCPFIPSPSLVRGSVMIAGVLGIHANNEFSRATLPFLFLFSKWLALKRIIYQITFIQLWRKKK